MLAKNGGKNMGEMDIKRIQYLNSKINDDLLDPNEKPCIERMTMFQRSKLYEPLTRGIPSTQKDANAD